MFNRRVKQRESISRRERVCVPGFCIFTLLLREAAMGSAQAGRLCVFGTKKKNKKTCAAVGQQFVCAAASCRAAQGKKSRVITGRVQRVYSRASETNGTRRRLVKYSSSRQTTTTATRKRLADRFDRSCETLATDSQYVAVESRLQTPLSRC